MYKETAAGEGKERHTKDTASRKRTKKEEMSGLPRRVQDEKCREGKRDEGVMGREGKKRDYLHRRDISCSSGDEAHSRAAVNQRPFLTRHPRL